MLLSWKNLHNHRLLSFEVWSIWKFTFILVIKKGTFIQASATSLQLQNYNLLFTLENSVLRKLTFSYLEGVPKWKVRVTSVVPSLKIQRKNCLICLRKVKYIYNMNGLRFRVVRFLNSWSSFIFMRIDLINYNIKYSLKIFFFYMTVEYYSNPKCILNSL